MADQTPSQNSKTSTSPLFEIFKKFERIQELDLMTDKLSKTKSELPKKLAQLETDLKTATTKSTDLQRKLDELEKTQRQQKNALEMNEERSKRSQERLAGVKSNEEYQALQRELEALKKNSLNIHEQARRLGEEIQKVRSDLDRTQSNKNTTEQKLKEESSRIEGESGGLSSEVEKLVAERGKVAQGVENKYLAAYDRIRPSRAGVGVAFAISGICKGCHMQIPAQLYVDVLRLKEIHSCPSCRRLLLLKDSDPAVQQPIA